MSIPSISRSSSENNPEQQLEKTSSLAGRIVTKVCKTTSHVICTIGSLIQSILSECIYVGSFGCYTLDDLKNYFFKGKASLEVDPVPKKPPEYESKLKRKGSKMSVSPSLFQSVKKSSNNEGSPYADCFKILSQTIKLSGDTQVLENVENVSLEPPFF